MRNLLDFLAKYYYWLVFALLEGASLWLLFRFNAYQGSVWFTSANTVAGRVLAWEAEAASYLSLRDVNRELTRKNLVLEHNNELLAAELRRLRHDSTYTEKRQRELLGDMSLIEAQVVTNTVRKRDNYITINKGALDGVKPEMGVVCGTGIVGIVYLVSSHYSVVMSVLNSKSSLSCRLRGTDYFGYLHWDGRRPLYAVLTDIPRHARFKFGDAVETSGFSAVFPAGIFVGKISRILNSEDGLSYELEVNLSTDFSCLRDVCVVATPHQSEVRQLERQLNEEKKEK